MNGPYLPDPTATQPDRKRATYCLVILDDYSRRVVAGRFAWHADSALLEQLLWEAIQRWGAPQRLYTDQGAIYTSDRLGVLCGRLNIRLVHTPPTRPKAKVMHRWPLWKVPVQNGVPSTKTWSKTIHNKSAQRPLDRQVEPSQ